MYWRLVLKEFGPNIQHIYGVDNIVADTISRLMSTTIDRDKLHTTRAINLKEIYSQLEWGGGGLGWRNPIPRFSAEK